MTFSIEKFISEAREAAQSSEPARAIRRLLKKALENPGAIADANPLENDKKMYFYSRMTRCRSGFRTLRRRHRHSGTRTQRERLYRRFSGQGEEYIF